MKRTATAILPQQLQVCCDFRVNVLCFSLVLTILLGLVSSQSTRQVPQIQKYRLAVNAEAKLGAGL